jgi:SAM-dependent methyltransferase
MKNTFYNCLQCGEGLSEVEHGLRCSNGHSVPFAENSKVPVFDCENQGANEYTIEEAAEIHENALNWVFSTFGGDETSLRTNLISRLHVEPGQTILVTGVGAGNDLPIIANLVGKSGHIMALDYAKQMLMSAVERVHSIYDLADYDIQFCVCDATDLPYADGFFDAAYHFGGLNLFPDIERGILEMDRVVKGGGRVVFCDEGIAPWLKGSEIGRMLINNNYLYEYDIPLKYLPESARNVNVSWDVCNCFYVVDYTVSKEPLDINIDVPHLGRRGGTIRTRYSGKLEGITPALRERVYAEAKKKGISRVQFLEDLLNSGLPDTGDS